MSIAQEEGKNASIKKHETSDNAIETSNRTIKTSKQNTLHANKTAKQSTKALEKEHWHDIMI